MRNGCRIMKVYIEPRARLVRVDASALLAGSQEERVEFRFETHTPSIWEDGEDKVIE